MTSRLSTGGYQAMVGVTPHDDAGSISAAA
jgi:hypothetical protein